MKENKSLIEKLNNRKGEIAEEVIKKQWTQHSEFETLYTAKAKETCLQDTIYHLQYLFESVAYDSPKIFIEYIRWAISLFNSIHIDSNHFYENLVYIRQVLSEQLQPEEYDIFHPFLSYVIENYSQFDSSVHSFLCEDNPLLDQSRKYLHSLLNADREAAYHLIMNSVASGECIKNIYLYIFQPVQLELGRMWQMNKISVAQEHYATAVTQLIMSQLYPYIFSGTKNGKIFIGTCVGNELHEIGIRMITDFFEMEGWDTYFIGANTPQKAIVDMVEEQKTDVIGISVTMMYHVSNVESIIRELHEKPQTRNTKIMVGGYPFNKDQDLWTKVGADGWANNAEQAIRKAQELVE